MSFLKLSLIPQKCPRLTPTTHWKFLLFSCSVVSDSLRPHGLQHAKLLCPSPSPRVAQTHVHWVSQTIKPSHPLSPPSLPALNLSQHQSFPVSQLFASGGQSIGVSASASVLSMNIPGWFILGLTGWISLLSKWLSWVFSSTTVWKLQFFSAQPSLWPNSNIQTWLLEKPYISLYGLWSAKWCFCFLIHCLKLQSLATWREQLNHWKRPWCWERLKAEGEEGDRGWDGWMAT